jgi:hypothetical protein
MAKEIVWPDFELGDDETDPNYIHPENIKLLLDLTEESLKSQIDGVRQMFSRLGTVLAQASALTSVAFAAAFWLLTHPVSDRPAWITLATILAGVIWTGSGALAVFGMVAAKFGAPGISPEEGFKQDVLSQSVRDMQLWVIKSHGGTLAAGQVSSDRVGRLLNGSIALLVVAPILSIIAGAGLSLLF